MLVKTAMKEIGIDKRYGEIDGTKKVLLGSKDGRAGIQKDGKLLKKI